MRLIPPLVILIAALLTAARPAAGQGDPRLAITDVLARAAKYVTEFEGRLAGVVAEEHYEQNVRSPVIGLRTPSRDQRRVLRSDFLIVRLIDGGGWMPFRDVFEVDGRPVRDREDRLAALFITPSTSSFAQAERIMKDSTRHNLGSVMRNINIPILALQLLHANVAPRIAFGPHREEVVAGVRTWRIDFRETERPTLVKTTKGRDLVLTGALWVDPASGVVMKTTLRAADTDVRADITVTYRHDPTLEMWVPADMQESYRRRGDSGEILGRAAYSNYRRFQVTTQETIKKPGGRR
jgi:hypothetical protein